jgi:DNA (cytosine-5)-methyltransferase 1
MLKQFARIVREAQPDWWLLENVSRVPDVQIAGYNRQRFSLDQSWWDPVSRLRHWQYGFRWRVDDAFFSAWLDPPLGTPRPDCVPAALANDDRPWDTVRALQGLPESYDLPGFTAAGKVAAVGNGVPQSMGRAVALAMLAAGGMSAPEAAEVPAAAGDVLRCRCGCGRITRGRQRYAAPACRKRAQRQREASKSGNVTSLQIAK